MMKNWKVWKVIDEKTGEVLFEGRKKDAVSFWYPRYVYGRQTHLGIYSTTEILK